MCHLSSCLLSTTVLWGNFLYYNTNCEVTNQNWAYECEKFVHFGNPVCHWLPCYVWGFFYNTEIGEWLISWSAIPKPDKRTFLAGPALASVSFIDKRLAVLQDSRGQTFERCHIQIQEWVHLSKLEKPLSRANIGTSSSAVRTSNVNERSRGRSLEQHRILHGLRTAADFRFLSILLWNWKGFYVLIY